MHVHVSMHADLNERLSVLLQVQFLEKSSDPSRPGVSR